MPGTATTILIDGTPTNGSDPWIDSLVGGGAWTDGDGGPVTIQWTAFQGTMDGQNSYGWTPVALAGLREALALWESVANIDFVEVASATDADAKFWWGTAAQAGGTGVLGTSDLPGYSDSEVLDVLFNAQDSSMSGALGKGSMGLVTMVHEIGHLLGLAHPHDGGPAPDATTFQGVDWWDPYEVGSGGLNQGIYTTMSYNFGWPSHVPDHTAESWGLQYGPMALDIAAIQEIYGANTTYASGDNVYVLPQTSGPGTYWSSIWDTGGIDTISAAGASGNTTIDLHAPTDAYNGVALASFSYNNSGVMIGGYTIARGVVIENAIGGNSNDRLYGNEANNRLEGGDGQDQLDGRQGADTMIGGAGNDYYYVDDSGDVTVEFDTSSEIDTVISTIDYTLGANLENLSLMPNWGPLNGKGNSSANIITGNEYDNVLDGGDGADELTGGVGSDVLIGGLGADSLSGGADADYLLIDVADTSINGGAGFDSAFVQTGAAVTLNMGTASIEWVQGNSGADTFNAAGQTSAVYIYGMGGNDTLIGSAFGDYLDGGDGTDTLAGGGGADLMLGNGGSDILRGEGGDDSLIELGGDSLIDGGTGFDSLFVWSDTGVTLNLTTASIEWVQGSVLGDDNLNGAGNVVNTFLYGWGGNDVLTAGLGDDYIAGGAGDDILTGGAGNDTMIGETGFDRYVYTAATWGSDTIHSFDFNGEKLDFTAVAAIDSFADFTAYEWDPLGLGYNSTTLFYTNGGTTSAITLIGVQTASLSDADFLFV